MAKKYPIAERFTSLQGEGLYTGTQMHFIRFAGCSVGKKLTNEERAKWPVEFGRKVGDTLELTQLPVYTEKCCTYDGREFLCDTDFRTKEVLTATQLLDGVPKGIRRICLTGGEPLNQPLAEFLTFVGDATDYNVHIETSGTVSLTEMYPDYDEQDSDPDEGWLWITVSPKKDVLPEMIGLANEIKLLVDENFDVAKIPEDILDHDLVWLQPINEEWDVNMRNVSRCLLLLQEHPKWRLSMQAHKIWKVR